MKMHKFITAILSFSILFCVSCEKDRLEGQNQVFEGEWEWTFTYYVDGGTSAIKTLESDSVDFEVSLRLNDKGMIAFFEDGSLIQEKRFKIRNQQSNSGNADIQIKVNVDDDELDFNDKLRLSIINDTLIVDDFPFNGRKKIADYVAGDSPAGNFFLRK